MKRFKALDPEVKFTGIFGVIAIIAICIEIALGGFSFDSVMAGIKDIAGTIVAVLIFIIAVKSIEPEANKSFVEYYEEKMELLVKKYSPLLQKATAEEKDESNTREIQKAKKLKRKECYDLNTNAGALYGDAHGRMANFCEIEKDACSDIRFSLNYTMFGYTEKTEVNQLKVQLIGQKIRGFVLNYIDTHFENNGVKSVEFDGDKLDLYVKFNRVLKSEKDAELLVKIIDCVLMNCLILSGREIKIINEH